MTTEDMELHKNMLKELVCKCAEKENIVTKTLAQLYAIVTQPKAINEIGVDVETYTQICEQKVHWEETWDVLSTVIYQALLELETKHQEIVIRFH
jgi:hypothetical protein